MRKSFLYLPILLAFILVLSGCGSKTVEPTSTEKLTKTWSVNIAKHDNTEVYKKGSTTGSYQGYLNYRLTLGTQTAGVGPATLTAVDGTTFTGKWALSSSDRVITLSELKSGSGLLPTGSNPAGTIVYNITSVINATDLTIETAQKDLKAGATIVNLQLMNP
jgi:hypothetical protein